MPEPLVASAATLVRTPTIHHLAIPNLREKIYGLLRRDTLHHGGRGWEFSTEAYHSTYLKHIKSLNHLKGQNDVGYSVLLGRIYMKARSVNFNWALCWRLTINPTSGTTTPSAASTASLVKMNPAGMSRTYD
jgi:hypothetical protein